MESNYPLQRRHWHTPRYSLPLPKFQTSHIPISYVIPVKFSYIYGSTLPVIFCTPAFELPQHWGVPDQTFTVLRLGLLHHKWTITMLGWSSLQSTVLLRECLPPFSPFRSILRFFRFIALLSTFASVPSMLSSTRVSTRQLCEFSTLFVYCISPCLHSLMTLNFLIWWHPAFPLVSL